MAGSEKERITRPAQGRREGIDPAQQQLEALAFANRQRAEETTGYPVPDTALHSAQSFYLSRGKDVFIADAPFRLAHNDRVRYSMGYATSRLLIASLPKYAKVREEMNDKELTKERSIDQLKTTLGAMFQYALKRAGTELKSEDFDFFKTNFLGRINPSLIDQVLKETPARYTQNKDEEVQSLKTAAANIKLGKESGLTRPAAPDDLSLMQRSFMEALFDKLRLENGTDIPSFIQKASGGAIQHVLPTGLWHDRSVENAISATDDSVDVAPKRSMVESFLSALPVIAKEAIEKRTDLSDEQKTRVLLAAEILYSRADQLRSDRLKTIDRTTVAAETASLNQRSAAAYGTLFKYGILPSLREPLDIDNRKPRESATSYEQRVKSAIAEQSRTKRVEKQKFIEARKPIIVEHLLAFMDRLDANESMEKIFPGTLGNVLSSSGEAGRKLYANLRDTILKRPTDARFKTDQPKKPQLKDSRPFAVLDEAGRTMIPPARMVQALEASYKSLNSDIAILERVGEQIRMAQFEILSTQVADMVTLAKRLDVLEADLHIPEIREHIKGARSATGSNRGEPGSLKWRSTSDMQSKIDAVEYQISDAEILLLRTRKTLLLKLVDQTRMQINEAPAGTDFGRLPDVLTEYELLVRRSRTDASALRSAINFFITE